MAQADILRVDIDAAPGGDGSSWGRAFDSLTDALAASIAGDQLWVAKGTYVPEMPAGRNATFQIPSGVQVFGGFQGNESSLAQRNFQSNITELNGAGTIYSIVTINSANSNTILDGFTVTKGLANTPGSGGSSRGAGIYATDSSPILRNLVLTLCQSNEAGAAIYLGGTTASSATIDSCTIENNFGIYAVRTSVSATVLDTDFTANELGALWLDSASPNTYQLILRCNFRDHQSTATLSPIYISHTLPNAITHIDSALIDNNRGQRSGAIYYLSDGNHEIRNSIFRNNRASQPAVGGGAVYISMNSANDSVLIENTLMLGNSNAGQGGAISKDGPETLRIIGSTLAGNHTDAAYGGGIELTAGLLDMDNSIIFDSTGIGMLDQRRSIFITGGTATADRCIIQYKGQGPMVPNISGFGTTSLDPLFVDADGPDNTYGTSDDNVRLSEGSPAIDAGNNLLVGSFVFTDAYGQPRFHDDTGTPDTGVDGGTPPVVDIGAAEFQGTTPNNCLADVNGDGSVTPADFSAWVSAFNAQSSACDQNGDGSCSPADFSAWVANYNAGC